MRRTLSVVIICAGIIILLFPQLQEWYSEREQRMLLQDIEANLAQVGDIPVARPAEDEYVSVSQLLTEEAEEPEEQQDEPVKEEVDVSDRAIAIISIDKINVKMPVLEGATKDNMRHAAAHLTETSVLGETGNAAIAAHRARTKGRLFNRLNEVGIGDEIVVKTGSDKFVYKVFKVSVVEPTDVSVLNRNDTDKVLTLITCDPVVDPTHRLIVHAKIEPTGGI
ncbi:class D sortase [Paenibacillaceae bacterium]|nr:class D sortase [Paenibacillaceae bacterium]